MAVAQSSKTRDDRKPAQKGASLHRSIPGDIAEKSGNRTQRRQQRETDNDDAQTQYQQIAGVLQSQMDQRIELEYLLRRATNTKTVPVSIPINKRGFSQSRR